MTEKNRKSCWPVFVLPKKEKNSSIHKIQRLDLQAQADQLEQNGDNPRLLLPAIAQRPLLANLKAYDQNNAGPEKREPAIDVINRAIEDYERTRLPYAVSATDFRGMPASTIGLLNGINAGKIHPSVLLPAIFNVPNNEQLFLFMERGAERGIIGHKEAIQRVASSCPHYDFSGTSAKQQEDNLLSLASKASVMAPWLDNETPASHNSLHVTLDISNTDFAARPRALQGLIAAAPTGKFSCLNISGCHLDHKPSKPIKVNLLCTYDADRKKDWVEVSFENTYPGANALNAVIAGSFTYVNASNNNLGNNPGLIPSLSRVFTTMDTLRSPERAYDPGIFGVSLLPDRAPYKSDGSVNTEAFLEAFNTSHLDLSNNNMGSSPEYIRFLSEAVSGVSLPSGMHPPVSNLRSLTLNISGNNLGATEVGFTQICDALAKTRSPCLKLLDGSMTDTEEKQRRLGRSLAHALPEAEIYVGRDENYVRIKQQEVAFSSKVTQERREFITFFEAFHNGKRDQNTDRSRAV